MSSFSRFLGALAWVMACLVAGELTGSSRRAPAEAAAPERPEDPGRTRSFRLGFTNFPHDYTVEAVLLYARKKKK